MTGPEAPVRRRRDTAVVAVAIEGLGDEVVTVTAAAVLRWFEAQPRGGRRGSVYCFDVEDCAAMSAAAAMLGRRKVWYRRIDIWRFETGPIERGKPGPGYQGRLHEPLEASVGVHACAAAASVLRDERAQAAASPAGGFDADPIDRPSRRRPGGAGLGR